MQKTLFHGTPDKDFNPTTNNPEAGQFDLCLTDERAVAEAYADDRSNGDGGHVYAVTVSYRSLADEEEAKEIVREVYGIDSLDMWLFEYLDDPEVMDAVLEAGFDGVEFVDQSPVDYAEHDTVRIYRADCVAGYAVA